MYGLELLVWQQDCEQFFHAGLGFLLRRVWGSLHQRWYLWGYGIQKLVWGQIYYTQKPFVDINIWLWLDSFLNVILDFLSLYIKQQNIFSIKNSSINPNHVFMINICKPNQSFKFLLLVKLNDCILVQLLCLMSLDLHCVCQDSLGQEWQWLQVNVSCLFESFQTAFLSCIVYLLQNFQSHLLVCAQLLKCRLNLFLSCELHDFLLVWNCNRDAEWFGRLTMEENFINPLTLRIKSFNLFSSNVLSLLKLENVFLSVNYS